MAETLIKMAPIIPKGPPIAVGVLFNSFYQAMQDTISEGQRFIAHYPPQTLTKTLRRTWGNRHFPTPVPYPRTGTLKRSWSSPPIHLDGDRIEGIVGSNSGMAPYNRDVQGNEGDRDPMFRDAGWPGIPELKEKMRVELQTRIRQQLERATK
jgi:hypothetical protein